MGFISGSHPGYPPATHLGGGDDGEGVHDSVGVFLTDFGDEERAHAAAGAAAQRVGQLEPLQAVARLRLLPDDVQDRVDQLGSLRVMTLGPVIPGARLAEHKIVWSKDLSERSGSDRVHRARFQVDQASARNVFPTCNGRK